jgi:hypothetical protein
MRTRDCAVGWCARSWRRRDVTAAGSVPGMPAAAVAFPEPPFLHAAFRRCLDAATSGKPGAGIAILSVPAHPFIAPVEKYVSHDFGDR